MGMEMEGGDVSMLPESNRISLPKYPLLTVIVRQMNADAEMCR